MDKVTRQCPQTTTFLKKKESRSGIDPRTSASDMVLNVHRNHKAYYGRGEGGKGYGGGGRGSLYTCRYLSLRCHLNDSCIQMGSHESHFNVSSIVRDKVTIKTVSTNHNLSEDKGEPKRYRTEVLHPYARRSKERATNRT